MTELYTEYSDQKQMMASHPAGGYLFCFFFAELWEDLVYLC